MQKYLIRLTGADMPTCSPNYLAKNGQTVREKKDALMFDTEDSCKRYMTDNHSDKEYSIYPVKVPRS